MRVLFTPHVEHYTIGLTQELSKYVYLTVLTTKHLDANVNQLVVNIPIPHFKGFAKWMIFRFSPLLRYDIIHANTSQEGYFSRQFDRLIVTEHGFIDLKIVEKSELQHYLRELNALRRLHEIGVPVVTISNYSAKMLRELDGVRAYKVIYHGLLEDFLSSRPKRYAFDKRELRILWVSRLVHVKEPFILLEALARIRNKINFKAIIRGEGPLAIDIKRYIAKKDLVGKVFLKARVPFKKLPELYNSCDIYIHTCSREPFGFSVLEAMGSGLPVITPNSGGAYEVAGEAALTFKSHDPSDLAEKILLLAHDAQLYEKLSRRSIERARKFTWKKAALEYLQIYKEVA